ncbi:MAG: superoxide dismutase family protein [Xanthomonadaceae bacterium]|mgnify:CR=1 FL=1|nr:superoxide dismutase family protein [Xanthomonadaceae bacterium]
MNLRLPLAVATTTVMLAACASTSTQSNESMANVTLSPRSGSQVAGVLHVMPMGDGVHVTGTISGLTPNKAQAFHIHEKGDCSADDASSAGGHFNPTSQPHGNAQGGGAHHLGDQANLQADAGGTAQVDAHFSGVSLNTGTETDVMGKAIVVHADADDYTSQPAGNAGKRIACGVIR